MSQSKRLLCLFVSMTAWGALVSPSITAAEPTSVQHQPAGAKRSTGQDHKIRDVELTADGGLRGQLVSSSGSPIVKSTIRLIQRDGVVATASTDETGAFKVQGIRGGLYLVDASKARSMVRVWSKGTAPPAASEGMLLIAGGPTLRGNGISQNFGEVSSGVFRWDEFGGLVAVPLVIGGAIGIQHAEQEERSDSS